MHDEHQYVFLHSKTSAKNSQLLLLTSIHACIFEYMIKWFTWAAVNDMRHYINEYKMNTNGPYIQVEYWT